MNRGLVGGISVLAAAALLAPPAAAQPGEATAITSGCSGRAYGAPSSGDVGAPGLADTAIAGHPGYRQGYSWYVEGDVGRAAIELRGYDGPDLHEVWTGVGLWEPGTGGQGFVPWGNSLATPAIRVAVPFGSPGVFVSFSC